MTGKEYFQFITKNSKDLQLLNDRINKLTSSEYKFLILNSLEEQKKNYSKILMQAARIANILSKELSQRHAYVFEQKCIMLQPTKVIAYDLQCSTTWIDVLNAQSQEYLDSVGLEELGVVIDR